MKKKITTQGGAKAFVLGTKGLFADNGSHSETLVSSAHANALHGRLVSFAHSVVPSTELGASMALLDDAKISILSNIDTAKLTTIKRINDVIAGWASRNLSLTGQSYSLGSLNLGMTSAALRAFNLKNEEIKGVGVLNAAVFSKLIDIINTSGAIAVPWITDVSQSTSVYTISEFLTKFMNFIDSEEMDAVFADIVRTNSDVLLELLLEEDFKRDKQNGQDVLVVNGVVSTLMTLDGKIDADVFNSHLFKFWVLNVIGGLLKYSDASGAQLAAGAESKNNQPLFNAAFSSARQNLIDVSLKDLQTSPSGWPITKINAIQFNKFIKDCFGSKEVIELVAGIGFSYYANISSLLSQSSIMNSRRTGDALGELLSTVKSLISFQEIIGDFYHNKLALMDSSYNKSGQLMIEHKKLLNNLRQAVDTNSARGHITAFEEREVFKSGIAGVLFSLSNLSEEVDRHLLTDIFSFGVSPAMIRHFENSAFGALASIKQDDAFRISDYGAQVSGFGITSKIKHDVNIKFLSSGDIQFGDMSHDMLRKVIESPENVKVNSLWYKIYGTMMILDPKFRMNISGSAELSSMADGYRYSRAVQEELSNAIRLINNCVGAQLVLHKMASKEWLRYYLTDIIDFCVTGESLLTFEEKKIMRPAFVSPALVNIKQFHQIAREMYKEFFSEDAPVAQAGMIPNVKFFDEDDRTLDSETVIQLYIQRFRKGSQFSLYVDSLRHIGRMMSLTSTSAMSYKEASNIINVKSSTFSGYSAFKSFDVLELGTSIDLDPSLLLEIPQDDLRMFEESAYRAEDRVGWMKLLSMADLLSLVRNPEEFMTSKFSHDVLGATMGTYAKINSGLTPFTKDFITTKVVNRLNKQYAMDTFSGIRSIIATKNLSYAANCLLRLASSRKEGLVFGMEPTKLSVVTSDADYVFNHILGSIGLSGKMKLSGNDKTFLIMIKNYSSAGGVLSLTRKGAALASKMTSDNDVMYDITELIQLNRTKFIFDADKSFVYNYYIRTSEMMAMIFQDTFRVNFADGYDVLLLEDGVVSSIRSSVYDQSAVAIDYSVDLDLLDPITDDMLKSGIMNINKAIEGIIFPLLKDGSAPKGDTTIEEEEEESED